MGRNGAPVPPGPCASQGQGNFVLPGKGENPEDLFLCPRLKDKVGPAAEEQVLNDRGEIDVQVVAIIFEPVRLIEKLEVRILPKQSLSVFVPKGIFGPEADNMS